MGMPISFTDFMVHSDPLWDRYPVLIKGNWKSDPNPQLSICFNSFDEDRVLKLAYVPPNRRQFLRSIAHSYNVRFAKLFSSSAYSLSTLNLLSLNFIDKL